MAIEGYRRQEEGEDEESNKDGEKEKDKGGEREGAKNKIFHRR
jgi:hypothetical protein